MKDTRGHFVVHVLPAAEEYRDAENTLSVVAGTTPHSEPAYFDAASRTLRRASDFAVAICGLDDRTAEETGLSKTEVRKQISTRCLWNGTGVPRPDAAGRMRSVADAWKHHTLNASGHTIRGSKDVIVVGSGYGVDGYGVGKMGGPEVMIQTLDGLQFKFLGDAHVMLHAWRRYLEEHGEDVGDVNLPL